MDYKDLWILTLEKIKHKVAKPSFDTWVKDLKPLALHNNILTVEAANEFQKDWIITRYSDLIHECINNLSNESIEVVFVSNREKEEEYAKFNSYISDTSEIKTLLNQVEQLRFDMDHKINEVTSKLIDLKDKVTEKDIVMTTAQEYNDDIWITIPDHLVEKYNLKEGTKLDIESEPYGIILKPVTND